MKHIEIFEFFPSWKNCAPTFGLKNRVLNKKYSIMNMRILVFFAALLFVGCKDSKHDPLWGNDSVPGALSNIKIENLAGAAKISYTLPDDPNVLYVQAEYTLLSGETKVVKSSVSKNYVLLEGFYGTAERSVKLFTVSRSEVPSNEQSTVT